jgi:hypothetical protein
VTHGSTAPVSRAPDLRWLAAALIGSWCLVTAVMAGLGVAQHVVDNHNESHPGSFWHLPGASPGAGFALLAVWVLTLNFLVAGVVLGAVMVRQAGGSIWRVLLLAAVTFTGVAAVIIGNNIAGRGSDTNLGSAAHRWLIYDWITLVLAVSLGVAVAVLLRLRRSPSPPRTS